LAALRDGENRRVVVVCVPVPLVALAWAVGAPLLHLTRLEFMVVAVVLLVAWLPVLLVGTRAFVPVGGVFLALYLLATVAFIFPWVLLPIVPTVMGMGFARPTGPRGTVARWVGTAFATALAVLVVGCLVVPAHGPYLTVCFNREPTTDERYSLYSDPDPVYGYATGPRRDLPGVKGFPGSSGPFRMVVELEPFRGEGPRSVIERRAHRAPFVSGVVHGDRPTCGAS
jgi:hypothetical protein